MSEYFEKMKVFVTALIDFSRISSISHNEMMEWDAEGYMTAPAETRQYEVPLLG